MAVHADVGLTNIGNHARWQLPRERGSNCVGGLARALGALEALPRVGQEGSDVLDQMG